MDENRLQSYLNLIQSLLTCPSGQEMELLQEHSELIDSDLIEVMQQVASQMAADGQPNAGFLQQLAQQISQALAAGAQGGNAEGNSAYVPLIQQLLSCPSGEEAQILQDNSQLLDAGFLQACEAVAATLAQQGNENNANFLRNLASQVAEFLGMREEGNSDSNAFLMQLLQTVSNSQGNPQQVYPFLQQNLDKLDLQLVQILTSWANDTFTKVEAEQCNGIAAVIGNLANLVQQFPLGSRLVNLEIAIAGYQIVLSNWEPGSEEFAQTQNNLATAYTYRIRGEKAENIEQAIECYMNALDVYRRDAFPQDWATTQNNLANAYRERIRGERAENIELAIASYTNALDVYTRDAFPEQWAMTQNNLANAYSNRIRGEKAQNIEIAIASYTNAAQVYTRDAFPEQWATTQNNLAAAYSNRIRGEKAQNIEMAIASYTNALEVRTRDAFPEDWAMTKNNLATAYYSRIRREKADNIEMAIASYTNALEVRTRDAFPEDWAMTQNNLAVAYRNRIRGEKAQNIELAIASYTNAAQVYTRDAFPEDWAMTQNNLALAYSDRIKGEKADNIELAITSYTNALEVRTRDAFPQDWAGTQNNLALAYSDRIMGEKADNIELAIASYTNAAEVYTRDAFPENWAQMQNNLAIAYNDRIRGEKAENIELAIASYTNALSVRTRDAFPQDWAGTQNNLANAYSNRIKGEKAENIELAIKCLRQALEVRTPSAFPFDCLQTGRNLGNLAFKLQDWENAIYGYEKAITAVEQSRAWAESQRSKRQILENALPIYETLVLASIHLERYHTALLTVERSKSRTLIELLDNATLEPKNSTPQQKQSLRQLRSQIASLQQQLDSNEPTDTTDNSNQENRSISQLQPSQPANSSLETELKNRQQQLTKLVTEINDPDFTLTQQVIPQLPDFTQFLDSETALIEWYLPPNPESGFHAFIVTLAAEEPPKNLVPPLTKGGLGGVQTQIQHLAFTPENRQQLDSDIATYLSDYRQETWSKALSNRLPILAQSLHLNQVLEKLPPTIQKLILIPHRNLHLLPLHALPATRKLANNQNQTGYLLELYPNGVQYAPSSQFLDRLHQRQRPQTTKIVPLFAIQNPTEDLRYTEIEVAEISRAFNPHTYILKNREATKIAFNSEATVTKLTASYYAHFSCHGSFNSDNPMNSALLLAGDTPKTPLVPPEPPSQNPEEKNKSSYLTLRDGNRFRLETQCLTLKEIFATLNLPYCRLVTLSACETGLVSSVSTDEYIGLASGFLYAGATNVVSSLWSVSDFSTAFLMIRFYENLKDEKLSVSQALQATQNWLRTVNRADFLTWLKNDVKIDEDVVDSLDILLRRKFPNPPFADPQYWAAFCAIGI
jgi:CHAT domain-containing protein